LQQHKQDSPNHTRYKPFPCALCNRSFGAQDALNNHIQALHYWCFTCSRSFPSHNALKQHYQTSSAHDESPMAKCPFCPSSFLSPSAVAHHIESGCHGITRHQVTHAVKSLDIVPSICITKRIEGASLTPPTTIRYYVASPSSFNGRAYSCFLCQRMFSSLSSLSDHLNSAAHDANEFKCPKCKKRFKLVSALIQHIESAACGLAQSHQIQDHFQDWTGRFSRLISM